MTTSQVLLEHTAVSVLIPLSRIQRHPLLPAQPTSTPRFPDLVSGLQSWLMVCAMRPPIVVRAPEDDHFYVVANVRTFEWQMHAQKLQGLSDIHVGALLIPPPTDTAVRAWPVAEQALMPLLLGCLSTREERIALKVIREAGIAGLTVSPASRRRRLKPLARV